MKRAFKALLIVVGISVVAAAQVMPTSDGGCRVAASGIESCDWVGHAPVRQGMSQPAYESLIRKSHSGMFVTRYSLAGGAPLTLPMAEYDDLVVGLDDGTLVNETAKAASAPIAVSKGSVMLVPKDQRITFRNTSGHELELTVIENREQR